MNKLKTEEKLSKIDTIFYTRLAEDFYKNNTRKC